MNRCKKCDLEVRNDETICPLCQSVLERGAVQDGNMYPEVRSHARSFHAALRVFVLVSLFLETVLVYVNYLTYKDIWWSAICGIGLLYAYITLRNMVSHNKGHIRKIFIQTIGVVILTVLIDNIIGYRGWSVNYAVPTTIIVVNTSVVVLMIVNWANLQNYILLQLFLLIASILMVGMYMLKVVSHPALTFVAATVSMSIFIFTYIIGNKRSENEIRRKFHM